MTDLTYYERSLPHWLPPGSTIFLTFRLAGTLPAEVLARYYAEWRLADERAALSEPDYAKQRRYFGRFDALLTGTPGPTWLQHAGVADIVKRSLHFYDGCAYELSCYCLMPNHVHMLVALSDEGPALARTLQSIKSYTAKQANQLLGLNGPFWHRETYDHLCRDGAEVERIVAYILQNPVKAKLVEEWRQWPHTFLK